MFLFRTRGDGVPRSTNLKMHGRKPVRYSCDVCHHTYKTKKSLGHHWKLHDPFYKLRYKCNVCGKGYPQISILNNHMITHTNVKLHTCMRCGKAFHHKVVLKAHMKVHDRDRMVQCPQCKGYYTGLASLHQHRLRKHKGLKAQDPIVID